MKIIKLTKVIQHIRWKEILAVIDLLLAFVFFRSERHELTSIGPQIKDLKPGWIIAGVLLAVIYILLQGLMYVTIFRSTQLNVKLSDAVSLFLKRNFLSVFLPAGGVSSLAYLPKNIRILGYKSSKIHHASAIYGFVGFLTVIIGGVPLIIYAVSVNKTFNNSWVGIVSLSILLLVLYAVFISFQKKNFVYRFLQKEDFQK